MASGGDWKGFSWSWWDCEDSWGENCQGYIDPTNTATAQSWDLWPHQWVLRGAPQVLLWKPCRGHTWQQSHYWGSDSCWEWNGKWGWKGCGCAWPRDWWHSKECFLGHCGHWPEWLLISRWSSDKTSQETWLIFLVKMSIMIIIDCWMFFHIGVDLRLAS